MKDRKQRRIHIHEPQAPSFIATTSTANRIRSLMIDAPATTAVEVETDTLPMAVFDFALGESSIAADTSMDINNNLQMDSSGLVVKAIDMEKEP